MPAATRLLSVFVVAFITIKYANACCSLKDLAPPMCCGVGPCNVFCCDCDGGCVPDCQACPLAECAGVLLGCSAACEEPEDPLCVTCLGTLYEVCKVCFDTSDGVQEDRLRDYNTTNWEEEIREEFDCDNGISLSAGVGVMLPALAVIYKNY